MFLEIELKLHIAPEDANLLFDHPFILEHAKAEPETHYLVSTYFDTPDQALRKNGLSLRIRQCGEKYYQTVKSSGQRIGDLHHRQEWENEITQSTPNIAYLTPDLQRQIIEILGDKAIQPIFTTEFQRTSWQLMTSEDTEVELAYDFGEVCCQNKTDQISEIELELKTGDSAKLPEIADVLCKSIPLKVENRSKAARGYQLCSKIVG